MGCSSMGHLASRSLFNVLFLLLGLLLLYWAICRELPELDADSVLILLDVRLAQLLDAGHACQTAMQELEIPLVRELCTGAWIDAAFVMAAGYLVFHCHRRWARYAMAAMVVIFFFDGPSRLFDATFPAPMIRHIDPSYAMVDEEITVRFSLRSQCGATRGLMQLLANHLNRLRWMGRTLSPEVTSRGCRTGDARPRQTSARARSSSRPSSAWGSPT